MRLYQQLLLFMVAAAVLPVALLGFSLLRHAETELQERIFAEQQAKSALALEQVADPLGRAVDGLAQAASMIDWGSATEEEAKGGLSLLYQESPLISATALVDGMGAVKVGPIYSSSPVEGRGRFDSAELNRFLASFAKGQLANAKTGTPLWGEPYLRSDGEVALALAIRVPTQAPLFVAADICLAVLRADLSSKAGDIHRLRVLGRDGKVLLSSDGKGLLELIPPARWERVASLGAGKTSSWTEDGQLWSGAGIEDKLSLSALANAPTDLALAKVRLMRRDVLMSLALAVGVLFILGWLFTRRIQLRLAEVVSGADALGRGDLSTRLSEAGQDELSDLSKGFNRMGVALEAAHRRLSTWNEELKVRVDEATLDLRNAQAQLVEAQKLAAVGQLGAGVAHEINNPLAGILGHTQLMMLDRHEGDPDFETLQKIEQSAKRCKEITQTLLRFSQQEKRMEPRAIDLNAVVRDALSLSAVQLKGDGVELTSELQPGGLSLLGDPGQLSQVVLALISNARVAMSRTLVKKLWVTSSEENGFVVVSVKDSGKGILPEHLPRIFEPFFTTKDVWSNVGLGLSVSFRVINEHQGKIEVDSRPGVGTTFVIRLPQMGSFEVKA